MQLTITYTQTDPQERLQGYKLTAAAVGTGMPSEVFVCQHRVPSATDPTYNELPDKFISLADPVDLEHYPAGAPDLESQIPFYRVAEISLIFRSAQELEETKVLLDEDVNQLLHSLQRMGQATIAEEVVYGQDGIESDDEYATGGSDVPGGVSGDGEYSSES